MSTICPSRSCRPSNVYASPSRGQTEHAWPNAWVSQAISVLHPMPCVLTVTRRAGRQPVPRLDGRLGGEAVQHAGLAHVRRGALQGRRAVHRPVPRLPGAGRLRTHQRSRGTQPPLVHSPSPPDSPLTLAQNSLLFSAGPTCPACKTILSTASLQTQLETQIRARIARYYEGWTVCDDPTCGQRTRMMGVYGRRCLRPGCQGHVTFEVRLRSLPLKRRGGAEMSVRCCGLVYGRAAVHAAPILCVAVRPRGRV